MKFSYLFIPSSLLFAFSLSACSTEFGGSNGIFRNRTLDYLHQPIAQHAPLVTPAGISAPNLSPAYTLPPGPNTYPAEKTVNLTPPGYSTVVPIPVEAPAKTSASSSSKTPPSSAQLKSEIAAIQAKISALKAAESGQTPAPSASLPLAPVNSSLGFDKNQAGLLSIDAPFAPAWEHLCQAILESGYSITKTDKGSHLIYVQVPAASATQTYLIFVHSSQDLSQVSVFTEKGVLDNSAEAYSLLEQIHANLNVSSKT